MGPAVTYAPSMGLSISLTRSGALATTLARSTALVNSFKATIDPTDHALHVPRELLVRARPPWITMHGIAVLGVGAEFLKASWRYLDIAAAKYSSNPSN